MAEPAPALDAPRTVPPMALIVTAGLGAFALTFCAALLLGRGFVGSSLSTLLVPIAASGGVAVALVAAFGVATTLEQTDGRFRVGRAVTVLTPLAAAVALFAYAADPTAGGGRALGGPGFDVGDPRTPRAQRTIGIPTEPVAGLPGAPAAPGPADPRPAADTQGGRGGAPVVVAPGGPAPGGPVAGAPRPAAPPRSAPGPQRPTSGPAVPEPTRGKGAPAAPAPTPERPRQVPEDPDLGSEPRTPDPTQQRYSASGPTSTPRPAAPAKTAGKPDTAATPKPVESPEPADVTPQRARADKSAKADRPAKARAGKSRSKPLPPACHRAKAPKRPAACRNR